MFRIKLACVALLAFPCFHVPRRAIVGGAPVTPAALALDTETVAGVRHYLRGYPADEPDGTVNAVVEIPSGTTAKFEVADDDGWLHWQHDRVDDRLRELDYLPFPVNYGMVPRTLATDGDALDIVVLGRGLERGHVARTRVIGVLKMGEDHERDDKLIAVPLEPGLTNGFTRLHDIAELDEHYPAARGILVLWFANYWGPGATHVRGWGDATEAAESLDEAKRAFTRSGVAAAGDRVEGPASRLRSSRPFGVHVR